MTEPNEPTPPGAFATPGHAAPPELPYATPMLTQPYASVRRTARVVVWLSLGQIALIALMLWPLLESVLYFEVDEFYPPSWEAGILGEMTAGDIAGTVIGLIFGALYTATIVFWMIWVYGTYRNLVPLGAEGLRYSPWWAVAYYFIPILNLFRPLQVMRETWKASDPAHPGGTVWHSTRAPALLGWWWAMHLASPIVGGVSAGVAMRSEDFEVLRVLAWVDLSTVAFDVLLLLLEIRIVRRLTDLQERRADLVLGFAGAPTATPTWPAPAAAPALPPPTPAAPGG